MRSYISWSICICRASVAIGTPPGSWANHTFLESLMRRLSKVNIPHHPPAVALRIESGITISCTNTVDSTDAHILPPPYDGNRSTDSPTQRHRCNEGTRCMGEDSRERR